MVIGHSGCSELLSNAIYLFHMPLFFFCSGTILTLYMSKKIEKWFPMINRFIYDIGNHTLEILALHFLSFRLVSFFVAYGYGLDVVHVAEHPVISDISIVPCYWWIVYSFAGIVIPLILNKVWYITIKRMLWIKL